MSLLAISLLVALGAQPSEVGAVLMTRKSGLTGAQVAELQGRLELALKANGLGLRLAGSPLQAALRSLGVKDTTACNGRRTCVQELVSQLKAANVVTVSASRVDGETALALELILPGEAQSTVKDSFLLGPGTTPLAPLTEGFSTRLLQTLGGPVAKVLEPPPPPPVAPTLVPEPVRASPPPLVVETAPPPPARSHATPVVLGTLGGVSLAAGVALVIVGAVARGTLKGADPRGSFTTSSLDDATAMRTNTEANVETGAGIGAAVVGAGLLTGAIITW